MNIPEMLSRVLCGTVLLKISSYTLGNKVSLIGTATLSIISVLAQEFFISHFQLDRGWPEKSLSFLLGSVIAVVLVGSFSNLSFAHLGYLHIFPVIAGISAIANMIFWGSVTAGLSFYILGSDALKI